MVRFNLSDEQADAILNLRLRHLAKLEENQLKAEQDELEKRAVKFRSNFRIRTPFEYAYQKKKFKKMRKNMPVHVCLNWSNVKKPK